MVKIAVCEDEPHLLATITGMVREDLAARGVAGAVDTFAAGEQLLLASDAYDIVFMDIGLAGLDGMEVARRLHARDSRTAFLFLTSHKSYALDAFAVQAVHYLVKPATMEDIHEGMDRALQRMGFEDSRGLMITAGGARRTVLFRDILCCEVMNHTLHVQLEGEQVAFYGKLDDLMNQLDDRFFRCHRSVVVNLSHVEHLAEDAVVLTGGVRAPLARRKRQELAAHMLEWLRREGPP